MNNTTDQLKLILDRLDHRLKVDQEHHYAMSCHLRVLLSLLGDK